jgi:hypothetical protein
LAFAGLRIPRRFLFVFSLFARKYLLDPLAKFNTGTSISESLFFCFFWMSSIKHSIKRAIQAHQKTIPGPDSVLLTHHSCFKRALPLAGVDIFVLGLMVARRCGLEMVLPQSSFSMSLVWHSCSTSVLSLARVRDSMLSLMVPRHWARRLPFRNPVSQRP